MLDVDIVVDIDMDVDIVIDVDRDVDVRCRRRCRNGH